MVKHVGAGNPRKVGMQVQLIEHVSFACCLSLGVIVNIKTREKVNESSNLVTILSWISLNRSGFASWF